MTAYINADGLVLGRLATNIAKRIMKGENVVVVNAEKAIITGSKDDILERYKHKKNVGSSRKGPYYSRMPHMMLKRTVRGMVPRNQPSGRLAMKRLIVHISVPEELKNQKFETIKSASEVRTVKYMRLGDVAKLLGAKF
ncbi:MAG: 50S ribosomal protein L13 [Thermoplasmata archaeon]